MELLFPVTVEGTSILLQDISCEEMSMTLGLLSSFSGQPLRVSD